MRGAGVVGGVVHCVETGGEGTGEGGLAGARNAGDGDEEAAGVVGLLDFGWGFMVKVVKRMVGWDLPQAVLARLSTCSSILRAFPGSPCKINEPM